MRRTVPPSNVASCLLSSACKKNALPFHLKALACLCYQPCKSPTISGWASMILVSNWSSRKCKVKLLHQGSSSCSVKTPPLRSAKITSCPGAVFWINCAYLVGRKKRSNNQVTGMIVHWSASMHAYSSLKNI